MARSDLSDMRNREISDENIRNSAEAVGGIGKIAGVIVAIGAGLAIVLWLLAVFRNTFLLAWKFPLFGIAGILTIAAFIFALIGTARFWVSLILTVIIGFFCFWSARSIYGNSKKYYPSEYVGDYIQKLPDGTTPKLYEKRKQKGTELVQLKPGEWVRVNGISFNKTEYNITTWGGITGWVEVNAFPKNAADWLFDRVSSHGNTMREIGIDRQVEFYSKKYLTDKKMSDATLRQAIRVNAKTPFMTLSREEYKEKGKEAAFAESGMEVTLERIAYYPECTMLHMSVAKTGDYPDCQSLGETFETLTVKDIETGNTYDVMPGKYRLAEWSEKDKNHVVFFFWPFQSRHFSITHTGYPQFDKRYGGILSRLSSVASFGSERTFDNYCDWNFAEISISNR